MSRKNGKIEVGGMEFAHPPKRTNCAEAHFSPKVKSKEQGFFQSFGRKSIDFVCQ